MRAAGPWSIFGDDGDSGEHSLDPVPTFDLNEPEQPDSFNDILAKAVRSSRVTLPGDHTH